MKIFLRKCKSKPPILWILLAVLFLISTVVSGAVICISDDYTILRIYTCMLFPIFHLCVLSAPLTRYEKLNIAIAYIYISNLFVCAVWGEAWSDRAVWIGVGLNVFLGVLLLLTLVLDMRAHDQYEREYREILFRKAQTDTEKDPRSKS